MRWKASTQYGTERVSSSRTAAIYAAAREAQQKGEGSLIVTVKVTELKRIHPIEISTAEAHRHLEWLTTEHEETKDRIQDEAASLAEAITSRVTEWLGERGIDARYEEAGSQTVRVLVTPCGTVSLMGRESEAETWEHSTMGGSRVDYWINPCADALELSKS